MGFFFFFILVTCIFWNLFILILLEAYYGFFCDNTHGLSFHFYLYGVKEENTLHFEFFEFFFVFCSLQFCCTIPNVCRSLSLVVVHSNAEPKLFRCVIKLHQSIFQFVHNMFHSNSQWVPINNPIFLWGDHTRWVIKRVLVSIRGRENEERKQFGGGRKGNTLWWLKGFRSP